MSRPKKMHDPISTGLDETLEAVADGNGKEKSSSELPPRNPPHLVSAPTTIIKIAHIHEQGQDIIIVPFDHAFINNKTSEQKKGISDFLQDVAARAGLKGTVCIVWESDLMFYFIAPKPWHPFFRSIDMEFVRRNLNRSLTYSVR